MPTAITLDEIPPLADFDTLTELEDSLRHARAFLINPDSGAKSYLARFMAQTILKDEAIFWAGSWDVWPSSGLMPLFDRIRSSQGFPHKIQDVQAERVSASEIEYLECITVCALYFVWDLTLIGLPDQVMLHASHDEWLSVFSKNKAIVDEICTNLAASGLKEIFPK